jgi:hypothetical protein
MVEYISLLGLIVFITFRYKEYIQTSLSNQYNQIVRCAILQEKLLVSEYAVLLEKKKQTFEKAEYRKRTAQMIMSRYNVYKDEIEKVKSVHMSMNEAYLQTTAYAYALRCLCLRLSKGKELPAKLCEEFFKEFEAKTSSIVSKHFWLNKYRNTNVDSNIITANEENITNKKEVYLARFELTSLPPEGNILSFEL